MEHIWTRMLYLRERYFECTQSKIASIMGVSENTARSYEKIGGTQPGSKELRKLWEYDKKLDIHWIVTGEGIIQRGVEPYDIDNPEGGVRYDEFRKIVTQQDKVIDILTSHIEELKRGEKDEDQKEGA